MYSVTPRVVPAHEKTEITIAGNLPQNRLPLFSGLTLESVGGDGLFTNGELPGYTCGNGFDLKRPPFEPVTFSGPDSEGKLHFDFPFRGEGEYTFRLKQGTRILYVFTVYALRKEWLQLRPFRGDMHLHSGCSGCCQEPEKLSPEYWAALNCAHGMDFVGISDHKQQLPSLKAAAFAERCGGCFRAYPCEEVHLDDLHNIHILNFGGSAGISRRLKPGRADYDRALAENLKKVPPYSDPWLRHMAANFRLITDWIREAGGVSVFCHPFWSPLNRLFLPECIREYAFRERLCDCVEVFGASGHREGNDLCAARYLEQCMTEGRVIPAVGNNDAHDTHSCAINSTVVFAPRNGLGEIRDALRNGLCVAVNSFPNEFPRTAGPFALVQYYHFLRRCYYPKHDDLCRKEAERMFALLVSAAPDPAYEEYTRREYVRRADTGDALPVLEFRADEAGASSVTADRAALDREIWG